MKRVMHLLFVLLLLVIFSGCVGPITGLFPPTSDQETVTIYIVNHGWHTGVVLPTNRLPAETMPPARFFEGSRYVEYGWGDEMFYRMERNTSGISVRAVVWPTSTVLHCVAVRQSVEEYFEGSGIIEVLLSREGFEEMCAYVADTYARDESNKRIDLGPGIYGPSRFYKARGKYFFPNTCNKWTARTLRKAGCPISTFYAVRAVNVFRQTSKFGNVIRKFND